jgi:hypothetical protein
MLFKIRRAAQLNQAALEAAVIADTPVKPLGLELRAVVNYLDKGMDPAVTGFFVSLAHNNEAQRR